MAAVEETTGTSVEAPEPGAYVNDNGSRGVIEVAPFEAKATQAQETASMARARPQRPDLT